MATREPRLAAASLTLGALGSALAVVWLLSTGAVAAGQQRQLASDEPCPRCRWTAPVTKATTRVRSTTQLYSAVSSARQGTTILLEPGEYRLDHTLDLSTPGIVVRGVANDPTKVTLRGAGMDERAVGVAVSVNAPDVTIADLTIGMVGYQDRKSTRLNSSH